MEWIGFTGLLLALAGASSEPSAEPLPGSGARDGEPLDEPHVLQEDAAAVEEETWPKWEGSFSFGFLYVDGNTNVRSFNSTFDAKRTTPQDRTTFKAWLNNSKDDGTTTQQDGGGGAQYDRFVTDRFFWLVTTGGEADHEANLDLRWYIGPGAGYQFVDTELTKLSGSTAVTYFDENFSQGEDSSRVAIRVAYDLSRQLTKTTKLEQTSAWFPSLEDEEDIYGRADTRIRMDVTDKMFAQISYVFQYDNTPADDAERVDHRVTVGVGWSF